MRKECQNIIFHFLLLIYGFPLPYSLPNLRSLYSLPNHSLIASRLNHTSFHLMLQFTLQFLMLLSGWRCIPVLLCLECWICDFGLIPCLIGFKLERSFKDSIFYSRSLLSAWIFKCISHWRSSMLTFQSQRTKNAASSATSRETSYVRKCLIYSTDKEQTNKRTKNRQWNNKGQST